MESVNEKLMPLVMGVVCLLVLTAACSFADVITVDDDGPADYSSIQDAIDSILSSGTIEVQPGTYYEHISYYGKTIVLTSTEPNNPDVVESTIIDGSSAGNIVTFNNGENQSCILTGFTIQNGQNGIYCYYSEPLIEYCVVKSNNVGFMGPGAPNIQHTTVKENMQTGIHECNGYILSCEIIENLLYGLQGCGGIKENCIISENASHGLYNCSGEVNSSTISRNGGFGFFSCLGTVVGSLIMDNANCGYHGQFNSLINCLVSGNGSDGVLRPGDPFRSSGSIANCTIVGNKGQGINGVSGVVSSNSIVVRNGAFGLSGYITSQYNNVWQNLGGDYSTAVPGTGDISRDPLFAVNGYWDMSNNWVEGEYHLRSTAGRWDGNDWVIDTVDSPCIDTGDPDTPIGIEPNPNGARINMGVYGGTAEASKSAGGIIEAICVNPPPMDFSGDCRVALEDFVFFALDWMTCGLDIQDSCWN